jgi:hypothetical protein
VWIPRRREAVLREERDDKDPHNEKGPTCRNQEGAFKKFRISVTPVSV